ncbi:YoaK family protein [Microbacterium sp. NPDC055988]|uniref:YoaK family protein n=1 Tax=Microbacterium sp. NPDC055988 TaxID=3345671 RepID=UPI0035D6B11F
MKKVNRRGLTLSLVLSVTAGYVDAIGFIDTGGLFVSFMSGNSTQAGVEVLEHGITAAFMPLSLVLAFVLGVTAGALVGDDDRRRVRAVAGSAAAVAGSAALAVFLPEEPWRFWILAFAMGAVNTLYLAEGRARVAITYATGTLVSLGLALAALMTGRSRSAWQRPLILWGSLAGGAVVGAAAHRLGSAISLLIAAGVLAIAALALVLRRDGRGASAT